MSDRPAENSAAPPHPPITPGARTPVGRPGVGVRPTWEPWAAGLLLLLAIGFGAAVLHRSAYSERRRTDAGVFFRAGFAARTGGDPYTIPDDNEWYFLYPPGIAAMFVPLADPPPAPVFEPHEPRAAPIAPRGSFVPYPVSIVLWYAFGIGCAVLSVELLARALIRSSPDPHVRALTPALGGWWNIRFWPLLLALPDILSTLSRGQINLLVLACISGGIYLLARGRKFWGGFALAGAACIKVIPGLIALDVLSRRAPRAIIGYGACGLAMMVALPALVYGPARAYEYTAEWTDRVLLAGFKGTEDRLQAGAGFADTDNLSIQGALHNLSNIATPRGQRPNAPEPWIKVTHIALSLGLLGATLLIGPKPWARPRREDSALEIMLRIGMLCCVMVLASPMSHRHYFVLIMPALAALTFLNLMRSPLAVPCGRGAVLIPAYFVLQIIPRFEDSGPLRDLPIPTVLTIAVWVMCARAIGWHGRLVRP